MANAIRRAIGCVTLRCSPAGTTGEEARTAPRAGTRSAGRPLVTDRATADRPATSERSQEDAEDLEEPRGPRGVP
jgi:hypothetical protein